MKKRYVLSVTSDVKDLTLETLIEHEVTIIKEITDTDCDEYITEFVVMSTIEELNTVVAELSTTENEDKIGGYFEVDDDNNEIS